MTRRFVVRVRTERDIQSAFEWYESQQRGLGDEFLTAARCLDGPIDADAESAWDTAILRRLGEIDAGTAELIDRDELRRRMRARMSRS